MNITEKSIVGQLVAEDYRTASVFKKNKIDFCCNGNRSIEEVCSKRGLNSDNLIKDLEDASSQQSDGTPDFTQWDADLLVDYIEKKHHRYVLNTVPELTAYVNKVARVHGDRHPELLEIKELFIASAEDLLKHMKKEENVLFPYIKKMSEEGASTPPPFGTVENPVRMMMHEHDQEGERFRRIASLSNDYTPPEDACNTYRVAFSMLEEFENDLHKHIHIENNILFPKAVTMEKKYSHA